MIVKYKKEKTEKTQPCLIEYKRLYGTETRNCEQGRSCRPAGLQIQKQEVVAQQQEQLLREEGGLGTLRVRWETGVGSMFDVRVGWATLGFKRGKKTKQNPSA